MLRLADEGYLVLTNLPRKTIGNMEYYYHRCIVFGAIAVASLKKESAADVYSGTRASPRTQG